MKRVVRVALIVVSAASLLLTAGVSWYAFSTPSAKALPLADDLVALSSEEGRRWLVSSPNKTDYAQLERWLLPQARRAFCGPATSAAVINAALNPSTRVTQSSLFTPAASAVKSELAVSLSGFTLEELARFLRAHRLDVRTVHAGRSDVDSFRAAAQTALSEPLTFMVVNYDRRVLRQAGAGHISPIGAYSPATDRVLILDVATYRYPYTWVPVSRLWQAMNTVDADSGTTRGFLLITADPAAGAASSGDASR